MHPLDAVYGMMIAGLAAICAHHLLKVVKLIPLLCAIDCNFP